MGNGQPVRTARWWIATVKVSDWDGQSFPDWVRYARGQRERGGTTGYEHWQFVVQSKCPCRKSALIGWIPRGHFEPTKSKAATAYVWKQDTRIEGTQFEHGDRGIRRQDATDWDKVKAAAVEGKLNDIPSDIYIRYYASLKRIAQDNQRPVAIERSAELFTGSTGTGKSRRAWDEAGIEAYIKNPNTKWWDGYKGETNIIIDEFR